MGVRIQHTHIFAANMEATLRFWREMFGAEILFDMDIAGARNVMIAVGSGCLNIYDQPPREGRGGPFHHLGLQTDDLDSLVAHMKARGFIFRGPIREYGYLRYIMAMAPDEILLEIFQVDLEKIPPEHRAGMTRAFTFGADSRFPGD